MYIDTYILFYSKNENFPMEWVLVSKIHSRVKPQPIRMILILIFKITQNEPFTPSNFNIKTFKKINLS